VLLGLILAPCVALLLIAIVRGFPRTVNEMSSVHGPGFYEASMLKIRRTWLKQRKIDLLTQHAPVTLISMRTRDGERNAPYGGCSVPPTSYRIGPFVYTTYLPIPELREAKTGNTLPTIAVQLGPVPDSLAAPLATFPDCEANRREFLLRIPGVANYYAHDGEEIVVDIQAGAPETDVRSFLMGSLFAALCHQRGLLPLHASAVSTPRGAAAFVANSGAGKSSMAAFLAQRGHRILSDDICVVDPGAPRERRVLPAAPWLKLWDTTLAAIGESSEGLHRIFSEETKYRYMLDDPEDCTPLAELLVLERDDSITRTVFEPLSAVQAMTAMLDFTFQAWMVREAGLTEHYFHLAGKALAGVRATRIRRPWGFTAMDETMAALEAHLGLT